MENNKYKKNKPPTGGVDYEVLLHTLFALSGVQLYKDGDWRLSAQNKSGEKFDDLVFEFNKEVMLLQAKFQLNKTNLNDNHFLYKTSKYSLENFSQCFNKIKTNFEGLQIKYCILCSPNGNSSLLFEKINTETEHEMLRKIFGDRNIYIISKKEEQISKVKQIADSSFISVFLYVQISEEQIRTQIQKKLNTLPFPSCTHEYVIHYVQNWYNRSNPECDYITSDLIKSFLIEEGSKILARKYLKQPVDFKKYYEFGNYKIVFIKGRPDWYLPKILKGIKKQYTYDDKFYKNVIVVQGGSKISYEILEFFKYAAVEYVVIFFTKMTKEQINKSMTKIKEIANTCSNKKIVVVGEDLCSTENDGLIQENILETIDETTIRKLTVKEEEFENEVDPNLETMTPVYIPRNLFVENQVFSENRLLKHCSKQVSVLTGSQRTGKSTVLKKLSNDWIEENRFRWVINLQMAKLSEYLKGRTNSSFLNFLCDANDINISTEIEMGLLQSLEKIILIDSITEHDLKNIKALKNIIKENGRLNISKVVAVITSYVGLHKTLKSFENIEIVTIEPLSKERQLNFFEDYLKGVEETYVIAGKAIFEKLLLTPEIELFCSSPLGLKIFVTIFLPLVNEPELLANALSKKLRGIDIYKFLADKSKAYLPKANPRQIWNLEKTDEYYSNRATNLSKSMELLIVIFNTDATTGNIFGSAFSYNLKNEIALKALRYINTTAGGLSMYDANGNALVHIAAWKNSVSILKYLIENCAMSIDEPNMFGDTPIQIATDNDCLDAVEYLQTRVNIHEVLDNNNNTLVHRATWHNSSKVLEYLIRDRKMSPSEPNKYGSTPLQVAIDYDSVDCVQYLKKSGVNLMDLDENGNNLVHRAAWKNAENVLKFLIEECEMSPLDKNSFGDSTIQIATDNDALESVIYLRNHVDFANVLDNNNNTLVHRAAWHNATKVLRYLIECCGISPTKLNIYGNSPLQVATDYDALDAIKYLHIDIANILDDNGNTLLHRAAWHNSVNVLKYLIGNCNMSSRTPNKYGDTPMQVALTFNSAEAIKFLNENI